MGLGLITLIPKKVSSLVYILLTVVILYLALPVLYGGLRLWYYPPTEWFFLAGEWYIESFVDLMVDVLSRAMDIVF